MQTRKQRKDASKNASKNARMILGVVFFNTALLINNMLLINNTNEQLGLASLPAGLPACRLAGLPA
jgi:hypothetical protein